MAGLLGEIFSAGNVAKRKLTDLLGNPLLSAQQFVGNLNDRARVLNQMTAAAAQEGVNYGPASRQLAGLLADAYNPIGMTVYHGSPAKFAKFDPTKIGSGEGAQAYGYGHYVAQAKETAEDYRKRLSDWGSPYTYQYQGQTFAPTEERIFDPVRHAIQLTYHQGKKVAQDIAKSGLLDAKKGEAYAIEMGGVPYYEKMLEVAKGINKKDIQATQGFTYEIDLPDEQIAKMLDFDKPLMQQSKEIQSLAKQYGLTDADHMGGDLIAAMDAKRAAGAEAMRQAGVPGIRYLDQGSRGTGQGTSNFVVFPGNEDLLRILERNNQPLSLLD